MGSSHCYFLFRSINHQSAKCLDLRTHSAGIKAERWHFIPQGSTKLRPNVAMLSSLMSTPALGRFRSSKPWQSLSGLTEGSNHGLWRCGWCNVDEFRSQIQVCPSRVHIPLIPKLHRICRAQCCGCQLGLRSPGMKLHQQLWTSQPEALDLPKAKHSYTDHTVAAISSKPVTAKEPFVGRAPLLAANLGPGLHPQM